MDNSSDEEKSLVPSAQGKYGAVSKPPLASAKSPRHIRGQRSHESFFRMRKRAVSQDLGEIQAGDFKVIDFVNESNRASSQEFKKYPTEYKFWTYYFILAFVGIGTGLIAMVMDLSVNYLSSLRHGICALSPLLNREICCEGTRSFGDCAGFWSWTTVLKKVLGVHGGLYLDFAIPLLIAVLYIATAAWLVLRFAPYAAGSGIPELKAILNGTIMNGFLSEGTLLIKVVGLALAVASGLNAGKEGPFVHLSSCLGFLVIKAFKQFRTDESLVREILTCACAAGVAVAFAAPIGGVLFALEESSSYFANHVLWRSFFCATVAMLVLMRTNPFFDGKLVLFEVRNDLQWFWFEMIGFAVIGAVGGLVGHSFSFLNVQYQKWKKAKGIFKDREILEAIAVIVLTHIADYPFWFLGISNNEILRSLFTSCADMALDSGMNGRGFVNMLCDQSNANQLMRVLSLSTVNKFLLTLISFGIMVPAGLFIPSLTIGACIGRLGGAMMGRLLDLYPGAEIFGECNSTSTCIDGAIYAIIGAAAVLTGVTQASISLCVIMFELTGGLSHLLPVMVAVLMAKLVTIFFKSPGIYDSIIHINRYPYLDVDMEVHTTSPYGIEYRAKDIMRTKIHVIQAKGTRLGEIINLLSRHKFNGFPIVEDPALKRLVGYISRSELELAINRAQFLGHNSNILVNFVREDSARYHESGSTSDLEEGSANQLNFTRYMDGYVPIVFEDTSIGEVYRLFSGLGIRYCCVSRMGRLTGFISKKDMIAYLDVKESIADKYFL